MVGRHRTTVIGHRRQKIWRNWKQTSTRDLERILSLPEPDGEPLLTRSAVEAGEPRAFEAVLTDLTT